MSSASEKDSRRPARYRLLGWVLALVIFGQGCASLEHYKALPANLEEQAQIPGFPDARDWADAPSKILLKSARRTSILTAMGPDGTDREMPYG